MEICHFTYHQPTTLDQACELGRSLGDKSRFLAGGTELLAELKLQKCGLEHLVSLQLVRELEGVHQSGDLLVIGALTTLGDLMRSSLVWAHVPALAEAIGLMAAAQIRNRATIGGNFCGAVPSADTPPICIACGAHVRVAAGSTSRVLPAEAFFVGPRKTILGHGEILADIQIPIARPRTGAAYERFHLRRATALAVAGAAAFVELGTDDTIRSARIALCAVAPVPLVARKASESLAMARVGPEAVANAARLAAEESQPIDDFRGSAAYRRSLVEVLTRRAIERAIARAGGIRS